MTAHTQRAHSKLAPSSAYRWIACPGSIRMSEGIADKASAFADEGTAAHELAQHCLSTGHDADHFVGGYVNLDEKRPIATGPVGDRSFFIEEEMADGVQLYVDFCRDLFVGLDRVEYQLEERLDLTHIHGLEGGTCDFYAYDPETRTLDVVDFKYGKGVFVDPKSNPQLLIYASGAIRRYHNRGIAKLRLTVVQPRCPADELIRTWECDTVEFIDYEAELHDYAAAALAPDAPLVAGEHCKFCKAQPVCPARAQQAKDIAQAEFDFITGDLALPAVTKLSPESMARTLREVNQLEDWCKRFKEHAHAEAMEGRVPPGFKLVATRATRKWRDPQDASLYLQMTYYLDSNEIFTEPELKSPAQIEPMMPGKNKKERAATLAQLVHAVSGGTVLAPVEDKRPAVAIDAATEFGL
jgi:hypothetical protein